MTERARAFRSRLDGKIRVRTACDAPLDDSVPELALDWVGDEFDVLAHPDVELLQKRIKELSVELDETLCSLGRAQPYLVDGARYRLFRQLVKDDPVRAQALVWNSKPSRTKFDAAVDELVATTKDQPK